MVQSTRPSAPHRQVERARREEFVRPVRQRHEFSSREAARALHLKERRWAPIAYAVFAVAILVIFFTTYTAYAFSEYRGVILPGVYVDNTSLAGLTESQARDVVTARLAAIYGV